LPHPDIKISPMSGDIVGNTKNFITVRYAPTTFTTAEAVFEFRTSEFDFQPYPIRIVGSA
jgi:hypothetical protein